MSAVGQRPTETYQDLHLIDRAIERMTVATLKAVIKKILERNPTASLSTNGLKRALQDRLLAHFKRLKDSNMANDYQENRRMLEAEFGTIHPPARGTFSYTPSANAAAAMAAANRQPMTAQNYQAQQQQMHEERQRAFANMQMHHNTNALASSSMMASNTFMPPVRPHFKASPFLEIKAWVGPAVLCPEAPSTQQRSSTTLKLQLNPSNLELLKRPTAIHQLRLFCTTKTSYDAATNPNHPAPVEFPLSCEAKVNNIPLTVNLKGKKSAAKVLAPHLNKDHAMYFGGQDNKVELVYTGTSQKYVLSVAICEIRHADTIARRIKRERVRSKVEVIKAMKVAAADDDIEMGDVSMGLKCPLGAMRMTAPVRSSVCVHMQCFDALSFLSLNEQTPSWQCPICDKTINPESLFLDGYVLDILEKVPDDEETVLVDAQGKWHTPNKKFSSEGDEMPKTPPRPVAQPQAVNTGNTASESGTELPPTSPPLPAVDTRDESQNKKVVEVFEIDDDDDSPLPKEKSWQQQQAQMQAQTQEQMEALKQNKITTATEKAREEMQRAREKGSPLANLQRLPSNSIMNGNGSGGIGRASSSREPSQSRMSNIEQFMNGRPSGIALKESPALPSPGLPSTTAAAPKPVVDVIDLTLSDSDDEGPMPPPRRRQTSTSNGPAPPPRATSSSSLSRPPSLPSIPQNGFSRFATSSSTPLNGLPGRPRETSLTNGSTDAFPPSRPSNGIHKPTPPPPRPIPAQSIPQPSPRRRSFSPEEGDYTDEDDSQPIIRKRKRLRSRNFVDSEEGEFHSSAERSSSSGGSSSERLYEEERAGLAVR